MMSLIKNVRTIVALMALGAVASAHAQGRIFTASIDEKGAVISQSPTWVNKIKLTAQPDYFSEYNIKYVAGIFKKAPRFCTVSVTDVSSNEHVFYGHAKLGGVPKINDLNVLTLKVGDNTPAGDSSMGFMLMCVE